jgi:hypothetical protein
MGEPMKKLVIVGLMLSASAFASTAVRLDMTVSLDGSKSKPVIITKYGKEAKLSNIDHAGNGIEISVIPTKVLKDGKQEQQTVQLKFEVSEVKKNRRNILATPMVTSFLGKTAQISSQDHKLALEVVPTEIVAN